MNRFHDRALIHVLGSLLFLTAPALSHPDHVDNSDPSGPPAYFLKLVAASANLKIESSVSITTEGEFRIIKSNGWPDHEPGAFPRRGNPNTAAPQSYSFRVPLKPKAAATPERRGGWWWGVAINGVPFEPGTAEAWNNDRRSGWSYEAATGFLNLGLDEHNAHVQPNGSYHYHALPTGLVERLGGDGKRMLLIGWAADGYPIYSGWAHADAKDPKSNLRKMTTSYHLKPGPRPEQIGGPGGNYDGRFTQDFEYKSGTGDLDECNGRSGVTPEFPEGTYYYCIIPEFPFVPRMWHGTPDSSFSKGEGPPGSGPRAAPAGGAPRGIMEGGGTPTPGAPPPRMANPLLTAIDLNKDGVLDADEVAKAADSLKSLDKDGDGKLTAVEFRPAFAAPSPLGPPPAPAPSPVASPAATSSIPPSAKPNILILIADDLGWGDVGFHGGKVPTPSIERLTKEGSELQRFYVHPVCSPTRAALLSGQMPRRFGVTDVMGPRQTLPEGLATLP
ncbi:MAG: YHYH protein, partial [Verrucomicrobiales bacterium]